MLKNFIASIVIATNFISSLASAKVEKLINGSYLDSDLNAALPRQTLLMVFPGGPALIPKNLQGTTEVIADILSEGPSSMTAGDYRNALLMSNTEIQMVSSMKALFVIVKAPAAKLQSAMELALRSLTEPRLDLVSFDRSKAKVLTQTMQNFDDMQSVVFFYGIRRATLDNPFIYDGSGSPTTVKNISLPVVKDYFTKLFDMKHVYFVTSGPASSENVATTINQTVLKSKAAPSFVAVPGEDIDSSNILKKSPTGIQVHIINKPAATDNQILFIYPEPIRSATKEDVIANASHNILGGGLAGRLAKVLRKERGLTYHAGSFIGKPGWMIYTFGGDEQVEGLLKGTSEVVASFKNERLTTSEISETKATLSNKYRERFELPGDILMEKIKLRLFGRNESFVDDYQKILSSVTSADIKAFVGSKINTQTGMLILMGDAEKLKRTIANAGYDPKAAIVVELDQVM